jgi:hypothetical protein
VKLPEASVVVVVIASVLSRPLCDAPVGPPLAVTVAPAMAPPVELVTVPVTVAGIAARVIVPSA